MKILNKLLVVILAIIMIPRITIASEIQKVDSLINPNKGKDKSISKIILENFSDNLSFAVKESKNEDNATFRITVLDPNSNPIPKVDLIVIDNITKKAKENQTNEKGEIQFRGLAPHKHTIKVVSAPADYYFENTEIILENNIINTKTIFARKKGEELKSHNVIYKITDSYGFGLKDIKIKLKSDKDEYISKTNIYGFAEFKINSSGKFDVHIYEIPDDIIYNGEKKINDIKINDDYSSIEYIYNSSIDIDLKDDYKAKTIVNVKKGDKKIKGVFVSLEDVRKQTMISKYTNSEGIVVFDNLFPGNYVLQVNNDDRLTPNGVGGFHLLEGKVREFNILLSQSDPKEKALVIEKKETKENKKLPESGSKDEKVMLLFAIGVITLSYLLIKKRKIDSN